ncbi:MAG: AroM family protein, partial [Candidatus Dormibacteraeota bacterium]|nr:AroM family protein [Candidatus Dormibacteraeota bacterium]MBO0762045.1 AroM family protein [Candidatus Dormibacteraeota bacterium]
MQTIGFATIGEAPRDDVVPHMRQHLPAGVRIVERGCLDGLAPHEVGALAPEPDEVGIVTRLRTGGEALLAHRQVLPLMQRVVEGLTGEDGADLVVVLCGADWTEIQTDRL